MDTIKIYGKDYVTVEGRVKEAHQASKALSILTEVLPISDKIVIKATVVTEKGTFTGISAANEAKTIEKQSPYEVAETSAVGRALGFAGYGIINGIATADEIAKTQVQGSLGGSSGPTIPAGQQPKAATQHFCQLHNTALKERGKGVWDHRRKGVLEKGTLRPAEQGAWHWCTGLGWHVSVHQ